MRAELVDLTPFLEADGDGVHWTLAAPAELNVNLVRLGPNRTMAQHRNDEVDVLVVVLAGSGHLVVDGEGHQLARDVVALLPVGATRLVQADAEGLTYLTVHRRRSGLGIRS
jgi:quercetin dioxygenase-like cupin family protein